MAEEKRVVDSQVEMGQVMLPEDTNPAGNVHGGTFFLELLSFSQNQHTIKQRAFPS